MIRDLVNRLVHRDQVRAWLARKGVVVARLGRGDWWLLPGFYLHTGHRYVRLSFWFLRWCAQWEHRG